MRHLETAFVEDLDKDWGNVYDKPYYAQAERPRHVIGRWFIHHRWQHGSTPMASFIIQLGGVWGWGRRRTDREGSINVWERKAKR